MREREKGSGPLGGAGSLWDVPPSIPSASSSSSPLPHGPPGARLQWPPQLLEKSGGNGGHPQMPGADCSPLEATAA